MCFCAVCQFRSVEPRLCRVWFMIVDTLYECMQYRYLHRAIQGGSHDSVEDARAALELVQLKLKYGPDFGTPKSRGHRQGIPLPMAVAEKGHRTCFVDRINMLKKFVADNCSGVSVDSDEAAVCPRFLLWYLNICSCRATWTGNNVLDAHSCCCCCCSAA